MPAKSGKGGDQLKRKYSNYVGRMTGPKTESAMALVLSIGITAAKELTPMEYGTLLDSAFRRISKTPVGIQGIAGFTAGMTGKGFNYAFYLHQNLSWKPRPPDKKAGNAWNPNAEPKFLEKGFTSAESKAQMKKAIKGAYK